MSFSVFQFDDRITMILETLGYRLPTPIQNKAIQPILDGKDLLGLAQTGTGKTAAFCLPILQRMSSRRTRKKPVTLIISPTRELAEQTHEFMRKFTSALHKRSVVIYGGVSKGQQIKVLRQGVDIVVACPGRLLDLVNDGEMDLRMIENLVIDEADQMLDQGFLPDIRRILKLLPTRRQNLVFSATMPREVRSLVENLLQEPVKISINHAKPNSRIQHRFYQVEVPGKAEMLRSLLRSDEVGHAIVFTRTKHKAKKLALQLQKGGFKAASLQGNMSQNKRQEALDGFKAGRYTILVATDIAARGIDVAGISHVINYDMPDTPETYTHRTGRTGRANETGLAISFATKEDAKIVKSLRAKLGGQLHATERVEISDSRADQTQRKRSNPRKIKPQPGGTSANAKNRRPKKRSRAVRCDFGL